MVSDIPAADVHALGTHIATSLPEDPKAPVNPIVIKE